MRLQLLSFLLELAFANLGIFMQLVSDHYPNIPLGSRMLHEQTITGSIRAILHLEIAPDGFLFYF
jgi:hypothetical protein